MEHRFTMFFFFLFICRTDKTLITVDNFVVGKQNENGKPIISIGVCTKSIKKVMTLIMKLTWVSACSYVHHQIPITNVCILFYCFSFSSAYSKKTRYVVFLSFFMFSNVEGKTLFRFHCIPKWHIRIFF